MKQHHRKSASDEEDSDSSGNWFCPLADEQKLWGMVKVGYLGRREVDSESKIWRRVGLGPVASCDPEVPGPKRKGAKGLARAWLLVSAGAPAAAGVVSSQSFVAATNNDFSFTITSKRQA